MKRRPNSCLTAAAIAAAAVLALTQLQPLVIRAAGAVDGSFGIRPMSHRCLGLKLRSEKGLAGLPAGDVEFHLGWFHFRYSIGVEDRSGERPVCLGQDIWYGE
jgi:hypothetical protein